MSPSKIVQFVWAMLAMVVCSAVTAEVDTPDTAEPLKIVKLQRTSITLPQSAVRAGKRKNFYSAKLSVGKPAQDFHVSFDLGGGTMVLPSQDCKDPACLERHRYDKWASETAEDIQANGHLVEEKKQKTMLRRRDRGTLGLLSIDVGTGKVKGNFVRDEVCLHGDEDMEPRCFPLSLLVANTMSDMPFLTEPYDGTVGLGLKGMSLSAQFNFLASFQKGYGQALPMNSFGLHIGGDESGGEITFGGYDAKRLTHPLRWASVADPQEGRWQVAIAAIRVGNHTLDACRGKACRAAFDYSSSLLSAPSSLAAGIEKALASVALPNGFGHGCQHVSIPDIHLQLADDVTLSVPPEDFVNALGMSKGFLTSPKASCEPLLTHHDEEMPGHDVFILGEATLRRYYTFFDADSLQVGFSLAASSPQNTKAIENPPLSEVKSEKQKKDGNIIVLVQLQLKRSKTISSMAL